MLTQVKSQVPTTQDCLGAIPLCSSIYRESTAPSGFGNYANEIDPEISCLFDDNNSIWYTFTVNSSGNLGFVITPNDLNDDYDWGLFNITNNTCDDINKIQELLVSCNAAGGGPCQGATGANGTSQYRIQGGGCESPLPDLRMGQSAFNNLIPVEAGNTYALMVSNWTGSPNGYEIDFGASEDIGIVDQTPPEIESVTLDRIDGCSPTEIYLRFTEFIQCQSIELANFKLQDSEGVLYDIMFSSASCDVGREYSRDFIITLMNPLRKINETYTLVAETQETHRILDICDNEGLSFRSSFDVTLSYLQEIELASDTMLCNMSSLTLDVHDSSALSYLWQDGSTNSDITITNSGTYSVTISNTCEVKEAAIDVILINSNNETVDLGPDSTLCLGTTLTLDPNLNVNYNYIWNDGSTDQIRNITESGVFSVTVSDECQPLGDDEVTLIFEDRSISVDLDDSQLLCIGESIILSAEHPNVIDYLWSDNSTSPNLLVNSGGVYGVTISNECESVEDEITIDERNCIECNVYIPNTMSRFGSNSNNEFKISSNCRFESYEVRVFDRWGSEVFHSNDPSISWNGFDNSNIQLEIGVYIYVASVSYLEFSETISQIMSGDILVID